jgi:hypothetical protein
MNQGVSQPHSFSELYVRHGFSTYLIDVQAGVPAGTTAKMMQDLPVSRKDAGLVLAALSVKFRQNYSLSNVNVKLLERDGETNATT